MIDLLRTLQTWKFGFPFTSNQMWESSWGRLGGKRECYLCAMPFTLLNDVYNVYSPMSSLTLLYSSTSRDLLSYSDEARSWGMISGNGLKISSDDPIKFFSRNSNGSNPNDVARWSMMVSMMATPCWERNGSGDVWQQVILARLCAIVQMVWTEQKRSIKMAQP